MQLAEKSHHYILIFIRLVALNVVAELAFARSIQIHCSKHSKRRYIVDKTFCYGFGKKLEYIHQYRLLLSE